jgi:hypothetical protein
MNTIMIFDLQNVHDISTIIEQYKQIKKCGSLDIDIPLKERFDLFIDACKKDIEELINLMINDLHGCDRKNILVCILSELDDNKSHSESKRLEKYLEILLNHGYDPQTSEGDSCPIYYAMKYNSPEIVSMMLKYVKTPIPIVNNQTILMAAMESPHFLGDHILNKLMSMCDIYYINQSGSCVFNNAIRKGHIDTIKYLSKKFKNNFTDGMKILIAESFMNYVDNPVFGVENNKQKFNKIITLLYSLTKPGRISDHEFITMIGNWLVRADRYIRFLFIAYEARNEKIKRDHMFRPYFALKRRMMEQTEELNLRPLTEDNYDELFNMYANGDDHIITSDLIRYSHKPTIETLKKFVFCIPNVNKIITDLSDTEIPYFFYILRDLNLFPIVIQHPKIRLHMTIEENWKQISILDYAFDRCMSIDGSMSENQKEYLGEIITLLLPFNVQYDRNNHLLHQLVQASIQHLQVDNLIVNGLFDKEYKFTNRCFIHQCTSGNLQAVKDILKIAKRMKAISKQSFHGHSQIIVMN